MNYIGKMMVHFNRWGAAPYLWCITTPAWQLCVPKVFFSRGETVYQAKATPDDEDGVPSAWLQFEGRLTVDSDGVAIIESEPNASSAIFSPGPEDNRTGANAG